jgi:hypothetical protein
VEVFMVDEVAGSGAVEAQVSSKITFPAGEPNWFEPELVLQDGVLGWSRGTESLTVVTRSWDSGRPLRLPQGLIALIVRAGGEAALADLQ